MQTSFRVIDTGIREARANIAFDQAMIELHKSGAIPDTLRFIRFKPSALIGRHQILNQEVDVEYCRNNNITTARRVTGGGAIYFDEGQLGWSLVFKRAALGVGSLEDVTRKICESCAEGLGLLGIDAKFRPRNDIEVDGRKISGTGGFFDGDTLFFQGTVLIDMNVEDMVAALRIPARKLAKRNLQSATSRVVTLQELLTTVPDMEIIKSDIIEGFSNGLGISFTPEMASPEEEQTASKIFAEEIGTDEFVEELDAVVDGDSIYCGSCSGAGGTITSYIRIEGSRQKRIREVLFAGDFFVTPPRVVFDLEASLRGISVENVEAQIQEFFTASTIESLSVTADDFLGAIKNALSGLNVNPQTAHSK